MTMMSIQGPKRSPKTFFLLTFSFLSLPIAFGRVGSVHRGDYVSCVVCLSVGLLSALFSLLLMSCQCHLLHKKTVDLGVGVFCSLVAVSTWIDFCCDRRCDFLAN